MRGTGRQALCLLCFLLLSRSAVVGALSKEEEEDENEQFAEEEPHSLPLLSRSPEVPGVVFGNDGVIVNASATAGDGEVKVPKETIAHVSCVLPYYFLS